MKISGFSALFIYLCFLMVTTSIGMLFSLINGAIVGFFIGLLAELFLFFYADKLVLMFSSARYANQDEEVIERVQNFSSHVEISGVKVYWSSVFYHNIYFVNSYFGAPSIIIGKELLNTLNKNELNSLLFATLYRLKSKESIHRTVINVLMMILFFWVFLLRYKIKNEWAKKVLSFYLLPAFFLKAKLYRFFADDNSFESQVMKMHKLKQDYRSALFKVNHLKMLHSFSAGQFLLSGLSHAQNMSENAVISSLFIEEEATGSIET